MDLRFEIMTFFTICILLPKKQKLFIMSTFVPNLLLAMAIYKWKASLSRWFLKIFIFISAWGFGILSVTIISLASMLGAFVVPLMNKALYKKLLLFMVSLAVGVLGGSGIFHLIPNVSFDSKLLCDVC